MPGQLSNVSRYKSDSYSNLYEPIQPAARSIHHGLGGHHVLSVDMFKKEQLKDVFDIAHDLRKSVLAGKSLSHILKVSSFHIQSFV